MGSGSPRSFDWLVAVVSFGGKKERREVGVEKIEK
jgi:hypothetical protein